MGTANNIFPEERVKYLIIRNRSFALNISLARGHRIQIMASKRPSFYLTPHKVAMCLVVHEIFQSPIHNHAKFEAFFRYFLDQLNVPVLSS